MKDDFYDLMDIETKESIMAEKEARAAKKKPVRVRKPDPAVEPEQVQPVASVKSKGSDLPSVPWRGPFRADGFKVIDAEGRTVCICSGHGPDETRKHGAERIAATMNANL